MNLQCEKCGARYRIDDSRIPEQGGKVKCKKCGEPFLVKKKPDPTDASFHSYKILDKNPLFLFESRLKNMQKLIFHDEGEDGSMSKVRETYEEILKSYQSLRIDISNKDKTVKEMEILVKIGKVINSVLDMNQLLNLIMDMVIKVVNAERGFLMLKDKETGELEFKIARNMDMELKDKALFTISSGIASRVAREEKAILTSDAQSDERFSDQASIMNYNLRSVMCVPLKIKNEVIGTIFVDNRTVAGVFTDRTMNLLTSFANQAAIAIENARLYESVAEETKNRMNLQRYLSPNVVDDIINKKTDLVLGGERIECSILFADICEFTSMSEKLPPEDIVKMLNEYFSAMIKIIFENHGTIDKFIGDSIMAIFGAPLFNPQSAQDAVKSSFDIIKKLEELKKKWELEGKPSFDIRLGINTGEVIAGNIGSPERMDYTVIGDNVNLAARLQSEARPMTVLISDSTYAKIQNIITAKQMKPINVKGKSKSIQTYEVTNIRIAKEEILKTKRRFIRKKVSIFATFKIPPSSKTSQCIIKDIGCGGIIISTRIQLEVGKQLHFDFTLPDNYTFNNNNGRIVFVRPVKDKNSQIFYKAGIEFTSLNKTDVKSISKFTSN